MNKYYNDIAEPPSKLSSTLLPPPGHATPREKGRQRADRQTDQTEGLCSFENEDEGCGHKRQSPAPAPVKYNKLPTRYKFRTRCIPALRRQLEHRIRNCTLVGILLCFAGSGPIQSPSNINTGRHHNVSHPLSCLWASRSFREGCEFVYCIVQAFDVNGPDV